MLVLPKFRMLWVGYAVDIFQYNDSNRTAFWVTQMNVTPIEITIFLATYTVILGIPIAWFFYYLGSRNLRDHMAKLSSENARLLDEQKLHMRLTEANLDGKATIKRDEQGEPVALIHEAQLTDSLKISCTPHDTSQVAGSRCPGLHWRLLHHPDDSSPMRLSQDAVGCLRGSSPRNQSRCRGRLLRELSRVNRSIETAKGRKAELNVASS